MRTFSDACREAREIAGVHADLSRHIDKSDGRSAWVEVRLVSRHAGAAAALQLGTWTRRLTEAGWTPDDDGSLWVEVDPDVPYVEPAGVPAISALGQLVVDLASASTTEWTMGDGLRARLLDEAKALGWRP